MSEPQTSTAEILVHVVRSGVATQEIHLPEGSTVADLLKASGIMTTSSIAIDGVPIEETVTLIEGSVVAIGELSWETAQEKPWLTPVPSLQDDEVWREYQEILKSQKGSLVLEEDTEA